MINFLFNPHGRVTRKQIWNGLFLPQAAAGFIATLIDLSLGLNGEVGFSASGLVALAFVWPSIAIPIKRFHDRDMSGWWVLWFLLFFVGGGVALAIGLAMGDAGTVVAIIGGGIVAAALLSEFVILYLLPSQNGANRFGPDPRDPAPMNISVEAVGGAQEPSWADRLADPERLAAAASTVPSSPPSAAGAQSAERASRSDPDRIAKSFAAARFGVARTSGAPPGARGGFGRRGA